MPDDTKNSWEARADAFSFYGFTDLPTVHERGAVVLTHGEGPYVIDVHGNRYLDANSGLWNMVAGFDHPGLAEAAKAQYDRFPGYHAFFGRMADTTVMLSEKMVEVSPFSRGKVFYTNSGSEANDTMVKMLWFLNKSEGNPEKRKILTRKNGYHGVTVCAASMTGKPYNGVFGLPLDGFIHLTCPHYWREGEDGESEAEFTKRLATELEEVIAREGADTIAAFVAEPVMGAGGVIPPSDGYFQAVQPILKKHGIPLIADEVICGFGRTGDVWGNRTYDFMPDAIIASKAMTAGYFPMGAVILGPDLTDRLQAASEDAEEFPPRFHRFRPPRRVRNRPEGHRRHPERGPHGKRQGPHPEIRSGSRGNRRARKHRRSAWKGSHGGSGGREGQGYQGTFPGGSVSLGTHCKCLHGPWAHLPAPRSGRGALPPVHPDRRTDGRNVQQAVRRAAIGLPRGRLRTSQRASVTSSTTTCQ